VLSGPDGCRGAGDGSDDRPTVRGPAPQVPGPHRQPLHAGYEGASASQPCGQAQEAANSATGGHLTSHPGQVPAHLEVLGVM
jgi:hypothetical protein